MDGRAGDQEGSETSSCGSDCKQGIAIATQEDFGKVSCAQGTSKIFGGEREEDLAPKERAPEI
eukprot:1112026-Amorphochlora_amoeboformis.AAC.1